MPKTKYKYMPRPHYVKRCAEKGIKTRAVQCYLQGGELVEYDIEYDYHKELNESQFLRFLIKTAIKKLKVARYKKKKYELSKKAA